MVSSDCRPWPGALRLSVCCACGALQKPVTQEWLQDIERLYMGYQVYTQANGKEQQVAFDSKSGLGVARSAKIADWFMAREGLPVSGKLLDVGCGNGSFLRAFRNTNKDWYLVGLELDDRNKLLIETIPDTKLLVKPITEIDETFDAVVMVHALEHIPDPVQYLEKLSAVLVPEGFLLIEVPNFEKSPFDILIADHCTHFTSKLLRGVVEAAGFEVIELAEDFILKELTLLARKPKLEVAAKLDKLNGATLPNETEHILSEHLALLGNMLDTSEAIEGRFTILASSISGTWLASELPEKIISFVDEDSNRVGGRHLGLPILSPDQLPSGIPVFVPLRRDIADRIIKRLSGKGIWFSI